jgi:hypothetical protein
MFEWFPLTHGSYFVYKEYFAIIVFHVFLILGLHLWVVGMALKFVGDFLVKPRLPSRFLFTAISNNNQPSHQPMVYGPSENLTLLNEEIKRNHIIYYFASVVSDLGWGFISMTPVAFSMFGIVFPTWVAMILMFLILRLRMKKNQAAEIQASEKTFANKDPAYLQKDLGRIAKKYSKRLKLIIGLAFFWPFLFMNTCFSFYDTRQGLQLAGQMSISTWIIRQFELREACPPGPPCHIYATLPEDSATGVFINTHTNTRYSDMTVYFDTQDYFNAN